MQKMLTKRQVINCLNIGRNTTQKKRFIQSIQESDQEFYTDEEVQKLQKEMYRIQDNDPVTRGPQTKAEWEAYDRVHRDGVWNTRDSDFNDYDGKYDDIWN